MDKQAFSTFCGLVARGLWNPDKPFAEGEIAPLDESRWQSVMDFAAEHRVVALAAGAVALLPEGDRPPAVSVATWHTAVQAAERAAAEADAALCRLHADVAAEGVRAIVIGDAAAAAHCPTPLRWGRAGIDLYVEPAGRNAASLYIRRAIGDEAHSVAPFVEGFRYRDQACRLHFRIDLFHRPTACRYFLGLETQAATTRRGGTLAVGDTRIPSFPPTFQILCMTADIQRRLIEGQLGWHEVCAWAMLLHDERTALGIAETRLADHLTRLGLTRLYNALGHVARQCLRLPGSRYAALRADKKSAQRGAFLLLCVNARCVPRCHPGRPYDPDESTRDTAVRLVQLFHRCWRLRHLCPAESFFTPWAMLGRAIKSFFFG